MLFECIDAYYDTSTRKTYPLAERPQGKQSEPIALTVAEVRPVYEGCFIDRALAFRAFRVSSDQLSLRQRALTRDDDALGRNLRRAYENLHPDVIAYFRGLPRCARRRVVLAAAHSQHKGNAAAQFRAAAAAAALVTGTRAA